MYYSKHACYELLFLSCSKCVAGQFKCGNETCDHETKCAHNQVYKEDLKVFHTCKNYDKSNATNAKKTCGCDGDLVKHPDGHCIPKDQCPCEYGGRVFTAGQTIKVGCQTFRCDNRRWHGVGDADCPSKCMVCSYNLRLFNNVCVKMVPCS